MGCSALTMPFTSAAQPGAGRRNFRSTVMARWSRRVALVAVFALSMFLFPPPTTAYAGFLGIEFDEDDCIEKYTEKMRWAKQKRLMSDICYLKHDSSSSRAEKRFAQCVLDSILEVSDDSQGKRVLQSCSSKSGDEATYRRFVGRFPTTPDVGEAIRQHESDRNASRSPRTVTIMDSNGNLRVCTVVGNVLHCL